MTACYTFYAMDKNTKDILEAVIFIIKDRMATKDDIAKLRTELKGDITGLRKECEEFRTETQESFAELRAEIRDSEECKANVVGLKWTKNPIIAIQTNPVSLL